MLWLLLFAVSGLSDPVDLVPLLTDSTFDSLVMAPSARPYFVQFMAPWCHYCKLLEPVFQSLAEELRGSTGFAKVDCTTEMMLRTRYQIMGFPTLLLFQHGRRVEFRGERSQSNLKAFLKRNHALSSGNLTLHTTDYRGVAEPIRLLLAELGMKWSEKHYALPPAHSPCYWRQTGGCSANGPREPDHDRHCHSAVPAGASGYCECADGKRGYEGTCEHGELRCSTYCTDETSKTSTLEIFDAEHWLEEGIVFPPGKELPLLVSPEGVGLRGTLVTMRTMARNANSPLYPAEKVVPIEEMLSFIDTYLQQYLRLVEPSSTQKDAVDFRTELRGVLGPFLQRIEQRLVANKAYSLVGTQVTLADLYAFYALSLTLGALPACLEDFPTTKNYFVEIGMRDALTSYLSSPTRLAHAHSEAALIGNAKFPEDPAANPFGM